MSLLLVTWLLMHVICNALPDDLFRLSVLQPLPKALKVCKPLEAA